MSTASDGERELLALAAHLPFVDAPLLTWIGRGDLVRLLPLLGRAGMFLERDPAVTDRYRATLVGGEFARRALPPPTAGPRPPRRHAAVRPGRRRARAGDVRPPRRSRLARDVVLAVPRPDLLGAALDDGARRRLVGR